MVKSYGISSVLLLLIIRAPFQTSSSHFTAFIVPFTSGSNMLYSCFLCASSHSGDRGVNDKDFKMKGFLVYTLCSPCTLSSSVMQVLLC